MPKHTRIYTRTGDDGTTGLIGGKRIEKHAPRIEAYGTVDELSCAIGVARAALNSVDRTSSPAARLDAWLAWTQDVLFNLGTALATPPDRRNDDLPQVEQAEVAALERGIDEAEADLPALDAFILPGGSPAGAHLHVARAICRRAERRLIALAKADAGIAPETLHLLNRLSDALFVWSRWINHALDVPERRWDRASAPPP
ncbi:MAG TPA: cob(I)yrinic acid a,c-diamide adenosyltransferase [Candidatus Tumulicola sp.]|jgi:cob(I)alamin adenosyltransferase